MILLNAYVTFTRKGLAGILAAIIAIMLVCGEVYAVNNTVKDAETNKKRVDYISGLGVTLQSDSATAKEVTIPEEFSSVYKNYNKLQKKSGFNLEGYKGTVVTLYAYPIATPNGYNGSWNCNLLVYNGRVIGGDISSVELNGYMLPLMKIN